MIISKKVLYKGWSRLYQYTIKHFVNEKEYIPVKREIFDSGDGAAVLLFNKMKETIILIRQFRLAAYLNGHVDGMIIEACAGMLDGNDPDAAIRNEILEETGFKIDILQPLHYVYATPGAHMEKVMLFLAEYSDNMRVNKGGGLAEEHEEIEVLEIPFSDAKKMIMKGEIEDAKTLILLQHAVLNGIIT